MKRIGLVLLVLCVSVASAEERKFRLPKLPNVGKAMLGQQAPEWQVDKWINLPEGKETLTLEDYKGKVVYLYFFHAMCPACHALGLPILKKVHEEYKDKDDVAFVAVQTVFENFPKNNFEMTKKTAAKYKDIPFGHSGKPGEKSLMKRKYKARGTPWTIIIGKDGKVKFNHLLISPEDANKIIDKERKASAPK